jgi:hypothetical protein
MNRDQPIPPRLLRRMPASLPGWAGLWLLLVGALVATGGLLGACLFPLIGSAIGMDLGIADMVRNGLFDGAFYALIWAPGLSLVACIMAAHEKGRLAASQTAKSLDREN